MKIISLYFDMGWVHDGNKVDQRRTKLSNEMLLGLFIVAEVIRSDGVDVIIFRRLSIR